MPNLKISYILVNKKIVYSIAILPRLKKRSTCNDLSIYTKKKKALTSKNQMDSPHLCMNLFLQKSMERGK